ncbi:hypothetical protein SHIRM173S_02932 [Streptomyces hirsutus]
MKMVGALLATFREAAGCIQRSLGEHFVVSEQQIASIEQGRRPLKPDLADQLDDLLDTKGALTAALAHMPEVDLVPLWAEESGPGTRSYRDLVVREPSGAGVATDRGIRTGRIP